MALVGFTATECLPMIFFGWPWWKTRTTRKERKRPFQKGEILKMYWKLRTPECTPIGWTKCIGTMTIQQCLSLNYPRIIVSKVNGEKLPAPCLWSCDEMESHATRDGFRSLQNYWMWFQETHGRRDATFQIAEWEPPPIPEPLFDVLTLREYMAILPVYWMNNFTKEIPEEFTSMAKRWKSWQKTGK